MEVVGADGPLVLIAASELSPVLDPLIEEGAGLRFEWSGPDGRWVPSSRGDAETAAVPDPTTSPATSAAP